MYTFFSFEFLRRLHLFADWRRGCPHLRDDAIFQGPDGAEHHPSRTFSTKIVAFLLHFSVDSSLRGKSFLFAGNDASE